MHIYTTWRRTETQAIRLEIDRGCFGLGGCEVDEFSSEVAQGCSDWRGCIIISLFPPIFMETMVYPDKPEEELQRLVRLLLALHLYRYICKGENLSASHADMEATICIIV